MTKRCRREGDKGEFGGFTIEVTSVNINLLVNEQLFNNTNFNRKSSNCKSPFTS